MDREQIISFLRENLSISIDAVPVDYGSGTHIIVMLLLDGEEISRERVAIDA
jgi:hypothetical protein